MSRAVLAPAAIVIVLAGIKLASSVAVPVLLALFIAFVTAPIVFRVSRLGVPNGLAVVLVMVLGLAAFLPLGFVIQSSVDDFRARSDTYGERLGALVEGTSRWLVDSGLRSVADDGNEALIDAQDLANTAGGVLSSLGSVLSSGLLVLLLAAFVLFDAARLWKVVDGHFSEREGESLLNEISHEVNRYLAVKTATSAFTGVAAGIACSVLGVDFAILWGLLAFLLNYIPTIGSFIAAIPPVALALVISGPGTAAILAAVYASINGVVGNVIEPRVMGDALGLSPAVVLISLVVCGYVLGPVGALLSVPLAMILKMALSSQRSTAWLADLMGGARDATPPAKPSGRLSMLPQPADREEE